MWLILQDYDDNPLLSFSWLSLREQFRKSLMKMLHRIYNRLSNFEKISRNALEKICGTLIHMFVSCFTFLLVLLQGFLTQHYVVTPQHAGDWILSAISDEWSVEDAAILFQSKTFFKLAAILYPLKYHLNECLYDLCEVSNPLAGIFLEAYHGSRG